MGINLKRVVTGVATGGNSEWGANGNLWGGGGSNTATQVPLETPEQKQARQLLLNFANSGQIGNYQAGQNLNMPLGDFSMTGIEGQGLNSLQQLMGSGMPQEFNMGDQALGDILNTSDSGLAKMFAPYQAASDRQQALAMSSAKRNAAFGGGLYSSDTIRNIGDVAAKTAETNQTTLAGLTNDALNRKAGAIGTAFQAGTARENIAQNRIGASMQYGGLERTLNNAAIQADYQETLRRRQEQLGQLDAAKSVAGANTQYGVPSVTVPQANPWTQFLQLALQFGGGGAAANLFGGGGGGAGGANNTQWAGETGSIG